MKTMREVLRARDSEREREREAEVRPDQSDPVRSFRGLFPSLISALTLIYIYEAFLCTLTSQLSEQQVLAPCCVQPRF